MKDPNASSLSVPFVGVLSRGFSLIAFRLVSGDKVGDFLSYSDFST